MPDALAILLSLGLLAVAFVAPFLLLGVALAIVLAPVLLLLGLFGGSR